MKIYLAGTVTGRPKADVLAERAEATKRLEAAGFEVFDPISLENDAKMETFPTDRPVHEMARFVKQEKAALMSCAAVLVLTGDDPSDGTWLEMGYALYKLQIPVILIAPARNKNKFVSWSDVEATAVVSTIDEASKFLTDYLQEMQSGMQMWLDQHQPVRPSWENSK